MFNTLVRLFMMDNMSTDSLPEINDCVDLYLHAWHQFGEQRFNVEQLIEPLTERETRFLEERKETRGQLDLLVDYGIVSQNDEQYEIRCGPEEDLSTWRDRVESPEAIYQLVQQARQRNRESGTDSLEVLEYEDESFVSLSTDETTDKSDIVTLVADKIDRSPVPDGIVIRSPADQIGHIQQVADELCDAKAMTETNLPCHFEKVASNVRGEHKDDLEYHLYLRSVTESFV